MDKYINEVMEKWGNTKEYAEYAEKAKGYSEEQSDSIIDGLTDIFGEFTECMESGFSADSDEATQLVKKLKDYITDNFYTCTDEILLNLGQIYVSDERFKNNIDGKVEGTAKFVSEAITYYAQREQ